MTRYGGAVSEIRPLRPFINLSNDIFQSVKEHVQ
jgi:hypothetical protein